MINVKFLSLYLRIFIIFNCLTIVSLVANDGFEDEDDFGGDEVIEIVKVEQVEQSDFSYYGSVAFSSNYSYVDLDKVTSAKISADLNLEYKIDDNYKVKSTIKAYEDFETNIDNDRDADINEFYLQGSVTSKVDIKVGRQIVVWGKSDNIRITDTLNPMDRTAPGMVDIEDLRLGRGMIKADYFMDKWSLSGIVLAENRFSTMPEVGSDYYSPGFAMIPNEPDNNRDNKGIALSLNGNLEGQDIAFYASNQYLDNTNYKSNMVGFAYNKVMGSFLLKTEAAHFINQCDKSQCDNYDSATVKSKTDGLVGLEYNGISDGSISLEVANKDEDIQYALRFTQSYLNQTLDFTALYSGYGKELEDGGFTRIWSDYAYNDDIQLSFGFIDYIGGDATYFEQIKDNDRIFGSLKYSF
ncbi:MAG: DUF1302 family protein [Campylobacterota bacterium]|nr:DUF1302 family protein [Campylobacterota bacterium]